MVVSLKQNYHFVDLLLDQAVEADQSGDTGVDQRLTMESRERRDNPA